MMQSVFIVQARPGPLGPGRRQSLGIIEVFYFFVFSFARFVRFVLILASNGCGVSQLFKAREHLNLFWRTARKTTGSQPFGLLICHFILWPHLSEAAQVDGN